MRTRSSGCGASCVGWPHHSGQRRLWRLVEITISTRATWPKRMSTIPMQEAPCCRWRPDSLTSRKQSTMSTGHTTALCSERDAPCEHRFALLNTCAYHGLEKNETKYGRVSGRTIRRLIERLKGRKRVGLNVLVCHHHLAPLPSWSASPDYEYVKKGTELLGELERLNIGPWLVVHGHRHWPDCIYAQGGSTSPVLFCAGSFGKSESQVVNQFHVITIDVDATAPRPCGTIQTWFWSLSAGWQPSLVESGQRALSYRSGFGYCGSIQLRAGTGCRRSPRAAVVFGVGRSCKAHSFSPTSATERV